MRQSYNPLSRQRMSEHLSINNQNNNERMFVMTANDALAKFQKQADNAAKLLTEEIPVNQTMRSETSDQSKPERNSGRKQYHNKGGRKFDKPGDQQGTKDTSSEMFKGATTRGINVFHLRSASFSGRHKYMATHYEVNLQPRRLGAVTHHEVQDPAAVYNHISMAGPAFRSKVYAAAMAVNAGFLTLGNTISTDELVNRFYTYLYNSRAMYSMLLTAWRCQNHVLAEDADHQPLSPILSNHVLKVGTQGWSTTSMATEVAYTTLSPVPVRQGMCFSTGTSAGVWKSQLVVPVLQNCLLPKSVARWCEYMFSQVHMVPTKSPESIDPRFVIYWPDGRLINPSTFTWQPCSGYATVADGILTAPNIANATIPDLIAMVANFSQYQAELISATPNLPLLFDKVGLEVPQFNFTRDIDGRSVKIIQNESLIEFIRSVAAPVYAGNVAGSNYYYYASNATAMNQATFAVSTDAQIGFRPFNILDVFKAGLTNANIYYAVNKTLTQGECALCFGSIAPLNFSVYIMNSSSVAYRWTLPVAMIIGWTYTTMDTFTAGNFVQAVNELNCINAEGGPVLPRYRVNVNSNGNSNGYLTAVVNDSNYGYYSLSDYTVSVNEMEAWIQNAADAVCDAL